MKAKLILKNGKEIEVEVKTEDFKKTQPKKTGYERVNKYKQYYIADSRENNGYLDFMEELDQIDENEYKNANYYNDVTLTKNNVRADTLMRQLRRFAVENSKKELDWNDTCQRKYYIFYNYETHKIYPGSEAVYRDFGQIYFDTIDACREAINEFKKELTWYFTEYRDRA